MKITVAGIGYGGSYFPKDTKSMYKYSTENDCECKLIKSTMDVNLRQRTMLVEKILKKEKDIEKKTIAILGLTFKANTDDIRESPANYIVPQLINKNCFIKVYDPIGLDNFKKFINDNYIKSNIQYCSNIDSAISNADYALIINDLDVIKNYDISKYSKLMKNPVVYDGRNLYKISEVKKYNIKYYPIGVDVERMDFNVQI